MHQSKGEMYVLQRDFIIRETNTIAYGLLTFSNVEFYLNESVVELSVNWNHFDGNSGTDNTVQWKLIPPLISIIRMINPIACRQTKLGK